MKLVSSVRCNVHALKKPGGGKNTHSVLDGFLCANVNSKAKPSKVVGEGGDTSFDVGNGFKKYGDE